MYVLAVLSMIKIYQSRHPDINARAHATFAVLAVLLFLGTCTLHTLTLNVYVHATHAYAERVRTHHKRLHRQCPVA